MVSIFTDSITDLSAQKYLLW